MLFASTFGLRGQHNIMKDVIVKVEETSGFKRIAKWTSVLGSLQ